MCRGIGSLQLLPQDEVFARLREYCERAIPLKSLQLEYEQAVRSRLERAALWLWVYLERLCHALAYQVRNSLTQW